MTMRGHSAANIIPVIASNRIGKECDDGVCIDFYGSSFITNHQGEFLAESSRDKQLVQYAELDLRVINEYRRSWGLFRDRRPELYKHLLKL